jgi:hypothetical protein
MRRYVDPQTQTVVEAMERARVAQGRHKTGPIVEIAPRFRELGSGCLKRRLVFENGTTHSISVVRG